MLRKHKPKGLTPADFIHLALTLSACYITPTHADTVYRCGEAYSTSSQCANGTATEVKPSSVLNTTGPDKANSAMRDMRDAQALEKQPLQAEQQAAQAAPIRLSTHSAPSAAPPSKGKQASKPNSPYFTAVDPTTTLKNKSTAKAVPATSNP
jgi:hypothetical protein